MTSILIKCILPEIIDPIHNRGMPLRNVTFNKNGKLNQTMFLNQNLKKEINK